MSAVRTATTTWLESVEATTVPEMATRVPGRAAGASADAPRSRIVTARLPAVADSSLPPPATRVTMLVVNSHPTADDRSMASSASAGVQLDGASAVAARCVAAGAAGSVAVVWLPAALLVGSASTGTTTVVSGATVSGAGAGA